MRYSTNKLHAVATNPWIIVTTILLSFSAFIWLMSNNTAKGDGVLRYAFFSGALLLLFAGYIYSIKVRVENIALRGISEVFYEINNLYKDKLSELFCGDDPVNDAEILLVEEETTLKAVCQ